MEGNEPVIRDEWGQRLPFRQWFWETSPMLTAYDFKPDELAEVYFEVHSDDGNDRFIEDKDVEVLYVYVDERYAK